MFDSCRRWRRLLNLDAEGVISRRQSAALNQHLAKCKKCRMEAEADRALREALRMHRGMPALADIEDFSDHVINLLRLPMPAPMHWTDRVRARFRADFGFLQQMTSGAVFAASLTALSLFITLHSPPPAAKTPAQNHAPLPASVRSEPPVPLSSLLQTPTPRAAMLWTAPEKRLRERREELVPIPPRPVGKPGANLHINSRRKVS